MKYLLCVISIFILISCDTEPNTNGEIVHNPQFNWTITIPDGFEKESQEGLEKLLEKGSEAIENTFDQEIENLAQTIFVFKKDETNYFDSSFQPFNPEIDGEYTTSCREVNLIIYETFMAQMPDIPMDSNSTTLNIDGLEFQQFNVIIDFPNGMQLTTHMFNRLFDKQELAVNIMYSDSKMGEKMLEAWKKSTFH
jgi:hypothetical protein